MSTQDDGGPAFPVHDAASWQAHGLSIRDYFAAKAMAAMLPVYFVHNGPCFGTDHLYGNLPAHAYRMADAMLKARARKA